MAEMVIAMESRPKIDTNIKKLIIEQSIAGKSSPCIAATILKTYNVKLDSSTIRYFRLKYKDKIKAKQNEFLDRAYATEPLAQPEYRLKLYNKNIQHEMKRKNKAGYHIGDGKVINDALRFAAEDLKNLEAIRLKEKELDLRKEMGNKVGNVDELIVMVEQRITITKRKSENNAEIAEGVQWAIVDDDKAQEGDNGKK